MKGDIILKVIIGFIVPFLLLYSFSCIFYVDKIGFLAIFNCCISAIVSYLLFYLRFGKINVKKIFSFEKYLGVIFFAFFCFLWYFLNKLL